VIGASDIFFESLRPSVHGNSYRNRFQPNRHPVVKEQSKFNVTLACNADGKNEPTASVEADKVKL
jgi:hypothetical protein